MNNINIDKLAKALYSSVKDEMDEKLILSIDDILNKIDEKSRRRKPSISYSTKIGGVNIVCNNEVPMKDEDEIGYNMSVSIEEISQPRIAVCESVEACSDEMISNLGETLTKLQKMEDDIRKTIDFLARSMVGDGEMSNFFNRKDEKDGE